MPDETSGAPTGPPADSHVPIPADGESQQQGTPADLGLDGPFDPERAMNTIRSQRTEFDAYKQQAQPWKESHDMWTRLNEDPEFQAQVYQELAELHAADQEFDGEDAYDEETDPQAGDPRVDALVQAEEQRAFQAYDEELTGHIEELAKKADVQLPPGALDHLKAQVWEQADRDATEQAFNQYVDSLKGYHDTVIDQYKTSKRAPAPPSGGQAGSEAPDLSSHEKQVEHMAAVMRANQS